MKLKSVLVACVFIITTSCLLEDSAIQAQELSVHQGFWSMKFYEDNTEIKRKDFESKMKSHPEAGKLWSSYKSNNIGAAILGGIGGYGLGRWITADSRDNKTPWIGMTLGGLVIGGIFSGIAANKRRDALFAYNGQFDTGKIRVSPSNQGVGLVVYF